jgi:hypothetical protein
MRTPRNLRQALQKGFEVTAESELSGAPEKHRTVAGKMFLELPAMSAEGIPGNYELVVPYTATYRFGKPRAVRANEKY